MPFNPDTARPADEAAPKRKFNPATAAEAPAAETPWQEDVGKSFMSGVRRGIEGIAGLPGDVGRGQRWLTGKVLGTLGASPDVIQKAQDYTALTQYLPGSADINAATEKAVGAPYEPQSRAGKYSRNVGEFATGAVGPGGPAKWLKRGFTDVLFPALTSETAGQFTEGTVLEPWVRSAAALASGPATGEMLKNAPTNTAKRLMDKGVDLTAGQATGSKALKYAESELGGSMTDALLERQRQQFTGKVMEGMGAPRGATATPDEMAREYKRIGTDMNNLAAAAGDVPLGVNFQQELLDAQQTFHRRTGSNITQPNMVNEAVSRVGDMLRQNPQNPSITGAQYARLRSTLGDDIRAARDGGDFNTMDALQSYQRTLDDAVEAHLAATNPDMANKWTTSRRQYRNYLDAERAVTGGSQAQAAEGLISPQSLRLGIRAVEGRRALAQGRGDYTELANEGISAMTPMPESGTSSRLMARAIPGAIGGAMVGGGVGAIPGAAATMMFPSLAGRVLMSRPMQETLMTPRAPSRQALALLLAQQQAQQAGGGGW